MRQLLNATYTAASEWMEAEERADFDRDLERDPQTMVGPDGVVDRSRNVEGIAALMGGPPAPRRRPADDGREG